MVNKRKIAHHEAGHAVIARVLGVEVEYATLVTLDGRPGQAMTHSMAHSNPNDLAALEKDAMVALAGPHAQHHYQPLSHSARERAWRDEWRANIDNAHSLLCTLFLGQRSEPPDEVSFKGERARRSSASSMTQTLKPPRWSKTKAIPEKLGTNYPGSASAWGLHTTSEVAHGH